MSLKVKHAYLALIFLVQQAGACSTPDIFAYEDPKTCTNIRVSLQGVAGDGSKWSSSNVTLGDYDTLKKLYKNPDIMVHFGDGTTLKKETIQSRINLWKTRAALGHPHGAWIIRGDDDVPMGLMAAGGHMDPGTCELSRMLLLDFQKLRLGSSVMDALVKVWAPATRAQGLQTQNPLVAEKFKCFKNEALATLYVSSSPSNVASWKSQVRAGFSAKDTCSDLKIVNLQPTEETPVLDFTTDSVEIYAQVEEALQEKFDHGVYAFQPDVLYPMIDPQGDVRTFSLSSKYKKIKYHFTYTVPDPQ